jgi:hypothetical protein
LGGGLFFACINIRLNSAKAFVAAADQCPQEAAQMVNSIQSAYQSNLYQPSSGVSQRSNSKASAGVPQDTVSLSDAAKDSQATAAGQMKGVGDVDHDGDSH